MLVSKVTQSFVFGATRYPEHRAQNSLFASLISFKGIWTQFLVDRSVTTGEHENIKKKKMLKIPARLKSDSGRLFGCHISVLVHFVANYEATGSKMSH